MLIPVTHVIVYCESISRQDSISVGCIPPAWRLYMLHFSVCTTRCCPRVNLQVWCPGRGMGYPTMRPVPWCIRCHHPSGQTDACEKHYLPATSFAGTNQEGCSNTRCERLTNFITSYDRPFGCPIMCSDIYSQCYYAHWHLRQCFIQLSSLANQDAIFVDKS